LLAGDPRILMGGLSPVAMPGAFGHVMLPKLHFRPHYALQHSQLSLALRAMLCENGRCQLIHEREISGG